MHTTPLGIFAVSQKSLTILCLASWDLVLHSYPGVKILLKEES